MRRAGERWAGSAVVPGRVRRVVGWADRAEVLNRLAFEVLYYAFEVLWPVHKQ